MLSVMIGVCKILVSELRKWGWRALQGVDFTACPVASPREILAEKSECRVTLQHMQQMLRKVE
jgi:hypothetical protein